MSPLEIENYAEKNPTKSSYRVLGLDVILHKYDQVLYRNVVGIRIFSEYFLCLHRSASIDRRILHRAACMLDLVITVPWMMWHMDLSHSQVVIHVAFVVALPSPQWSRAIPWIFTAHELRDEFRSAMDHADLLVFLWGVIGRSLFHWCTWLGLSRSEYSRISLNADFLRCS